MIKKTFQIEGMHCVSCALMIESDLEDVGAKARCSYVKQTLDVEYDEKKLTEQKIKDVVATSGYRVKS